VRIASSDRNGSPPISPQTQQLHIAAQAALSVAVSARLVNLALQPCTLLVGQRTHWQSHAAFAISACGSSARAYRGAARSNGRGNLHAQQRAFPLMRVGVSPCHRLECIRFPFRCRAGEGDG